MDQKPDLQFFALRGIELVEAGTDVAAEIRRSLVRMGLELLDGDILALAQKIVSKSEGRELCLENVSPSPEAERLAAGTDRDPRLVELILSESKEIVRQRGGVVITRTRLGFVQANAGIDQSNVDHGAGEKALLLPIDPDASARRLREGISSASGCRVGVMIIDSMNRPWRLGSVGAVIGSAGIDVLDDRRGSHDLFGRRLESTLVNRVDSLAATAGLLMGEAAEGIPVVLIRGLPAAESDDTARDLIRPLADDLFR